MRAIGRRLRRNYGWLFLIQGVAYYAKIGMHPSDVSSWAEFLHRAHIGPIPGWIALISGVLFHLSWIAFAYYTWRLDRADKRITADYLDPELASGVAENNL